MHSIKCVVWDLDNTIWHGVLLEEQHVYLRDEIKNIIDELDKRGIIQSICSKNDHDVAMQYLQEFGITEYFVYPQISWEPKSTSIKRLQEHLRIGMNTMMLIDDQPFERDEVKAAHPEVSCFDALHYQQLLSLACLQPEFMTEETRTRRQMYQADLHRESDEQRYIGTPESFLRSLNLKFFIGQAQAEDLLRVQELTVRTNQLNATGITYSYEELDAFRRSDQYLLLVCELIDNYGSYGKIGIALIEIQETCWVIKLLLMSCRVVSRGAGALLLSYIAQQCKGKGKRLLADFQHTGRNKLMFVSYRFSGFKQISSSGDGLILMENDLNNVQPFPAYIEVMQV